MTGSSLEAFIQDAKALGELERRVRVTGRWSCDPVYILSSHSIASDGELIIFAGSAIKDVQVALRHGD